MINGLGPKKLINLHLQSGQQSKEKPKGKGEIREEKVEGEWKLYSWSQKN